MDNKSIQTTIAIDTQINPIRPQIILNNEPRILPVKLDIPIFQASLEFFPLLFLHRKHQIMPQRLKKEEQQLSEPTMGTGIPTKIPARLPIIEPTTENHIPVWLPPAFFVLIAPVKNSRISPVIARIKTIKIMIIPKLQGDSFGINHEYRLTNTNIIQFPPYARDIKTNRNHKN